MGKRIPRLSSGKLGDLLRALAEAMLVPDRVRAEEDQKVAADRTPVPTSLGKDVPRGALASEHRPALKRARMTSGDILLEVPGSRHPIPWKIDLEWERTDRPEGVRIVTSKSRHDIRQIPLTPATPIQHPPTTEATTEATPQQPTTTWYPDPALDGLPPA